MPRGPLCANLMQIINAIPATVEAPGRRRALKVYLIRCKWQTGLWGLGLEPEWQARQPTAAPELPVAGWASPDMMWAWTERMFGGRKLTHSSRRSQRCGVSLAEEAPFCFSTPGTQLSHNCQNCQYVLSQAKAHLELMECISTVLHRTYGQACSIDLVTSLDKLPWMQSALQSSAQRAACTGATEVCGQTQGWHLLAWTVCAGVWLHTAARGDISVCGRFWVMAVSIACPFISISLGSPAFSPLPYV